MKRCPQCEFLYEDDQTSCDMDGNRLISDSRPLPKLQSLAGPAATEGTHWKTRALAAVGCLVLGSVLGLVYHVSTHRQVALRSDQQSAQETTTPVIQQPGSAQSSGSEPAAPVETGIDSPRAATPAKPADEKPGEPARTKELDTKASETKTTSPKATRAKQGTPARNVIVEPEKKESKIGSLLKKTASVLKRPFKR